MPVKVQFHFALYEEIVMPPMGWPIHYFMVNGITVATYTRSALGSNFTIATPLKDIRIRQPNQPHEKDARVICYNIADKFIELLKDYKHGSNTKRSELIDFTITKG